MKFPIHVGVHLLVLAAASGAVPKVGSRDSGFHGSCSGDNSEIRAGTIFLVATCQDDDQDQGATQFDLNNCLQNANGQLECFPQVGFFMTCEYDAKTTYQDAVLSMYCRNSTGSLLWSSYDLSKSRSGRV